MTGQRSSRARRSILVIGAVLSLTGSSMAVANAAGGTVSLDVSWMRPGVVDPMTPPAALRVGDVVTVHSSSSGVVQPHCQVIFSGVSPDHNDPQMLVIHGASSSSTCPDWTFVVPPAPPGEYVFQADAWDTMTATAQIPVTIEAGGTHVPFVSNFPVSSWDPSDTITSGSVAFGSPFTVGLPAGMTGCEIDVFGTPYTGVKAADPTCADWAVTMPELRPDAAISGPFATPLAGHFFIDGHGFGAGGRGYEVKTNSVPIAIVASGGGSFASSIPAAVFPAATNPYFVAAGSVPLQPTLIGIASGTCAFLVKTPSQNQMFDAGTVAVAGGQCGPVAVDANELGTYLVDVRVSQAATQIAETWDGFVVTEPIPAPTIGVPADPPGLDVDVPILVSVPKGSPTSYAITITPAAACTGLTGTLDVMNTVRGATAMCQFHSAGTYDIDATMTDALGTITTSSRTLVVAPPLTVTTPTVSLLKTTSFAGGTVPVRVAWSGTDTDGAIAGYDVDRQTDGGAWLPVASDLPTTTLDQSLAIGHFYRFRVHVTDDNAHEATSGTSATLSLRRFAETNAAISYTGTWAISHSISYYGGVAKASSKSGSTASIRATMRTFEWVSRIGPTRGKAKVSVDGVVVATVDLHATTVGGQRIVWSKTWSTAGAHRVTITVAGTAGHPSVILDEFVVAS